MRPTFTASVLTLLFVGCATASHSDAAHPHWSYAGRDGPDHWGELSPEFAACSGGSRQSPIALSGAVTAPSAEYRMHYPAAATTLRHNGQTIQADVADGSPLVIAGEPYRLVQYHFHAPSEHVIGGERLPLELHLVHRGPRGLAVLGVLIQAGRDNPAYQPLLDALPRRRGQERTLAGVLSPATLVGPLDRVYRYAGSLTTPPCAEGVEWHVVAAPVELSEAQIARLTGVLGGNSRPVQPLNGRQVELTTH